MVGNMDAGRAGRDAAVHRGGCQALPGLGIVTQEVRAFPSFEACEQTRKQMGKTVGRQQTTMQVRDPQTGQPATARHAMVWACQPGAGA